MLLYEPIDKVKALDYLKNSAAAYDEAYRLELNPYPLSNMLQLESISRLVAEDEITKEDSAFIKEAKKIIQQRLEKFEAEKEKLDNFWQRAEYPNLILSRFLIGYKDVNKMKVFNAYKELWDWAGSKNDKEKEIEHLETIECALRISKGTKADGLLRDIQQLKTELKDIL